MWGWVGRAQTRTRPTGWPGTWKVCTGCLRSSIQLASATRQYCPYMPRLRRAWRHALAARQQPGTSPHLPEVASAHIALEEQQVVVGLCPPQLGHPLGRLPVAWAWGKGESMSSREDGSQGRVRRLGGMPDRAPRGCSSGTMACSAAPLAQQSQSPEQQKGRCSACVRGVRQGSALVARRAPTRGSCRPAVTRMLG